MVTQVLPPQAVVVTKDLPVLLGLRVQLVIEVHKDPWDQRALLQQVVVETKAQRVLKDP